MRLKCGTCLKNKDTTSFTLDRSKTRGFANVCKSCKKVYDLQYVKINKDKRKVQTRNLYLRNRDYIIKKSSEYYSKNKDYVLNKRKQNLHLTAAKDRIRFKTNIVYKLSKMFRSRLKDVLGANKPRGAFMKFLGCSKQELVQHIEKQFYNKKDTNTPMSWVNHGYGAGKWQIDHIIPFALLDLTKLSNIKKVCHYKNLQPLWHEDHLIKTKQDLGKISEKRIKSAKNKKPKLG